MRWITGAGVGVAVIATACLTFAFHDEIERALGGRMGAEARARAALETVVVDPESLKLREVYAGSEGAVCGEFNARNRMGGYGGFRVFVVTADGALRADWTDRPRTADERAEARALVAAWRAHCDAGAPAGP